MFEVTLLVLAVSFVAAYVYFPNQTQTFFSKLAQLAGGSDKSPSDSANKLIVPEDSTLRRHFLTHLQSEIEATLFPRPTDSILQRHYDALVAAELENRLLVLAK